jgi:Flp pilus assembly protein TadG
MRGFACRGSVAGRRAVVARRPGVPPLAPPFEGGGFWSRTLPRGRRGAVAVEFAAVAPVLLAVVVGLTELSRVYNVQNTLETAAREGARFAAMDRTGLMQEGQTANTKLIADVKNFLASSGINKNDVTVSVVDAVTGATFDLDDVDNDLRLFQIRISVPYTKIAYTPTAKHYNNTNLSTTLTFRNGRATLSQ